MLKLQRKLLSQEDLLGDSAGLDEQCIMWCSVEVVVFLVVCCVIHGCSYDSLSKIP